MRRRRIDEYGMRRTNISDGNCDDVLPLALNQVNQHGNGQRGQAGEEEWREKRHLSSSVSVDRGSTSS